MSDNRREALEALRDKVKAGVDIQPREFRVIAPEGLIANDDLYEFWIDAWVNAEKAHNGSLDAARVLHDAVLPGWGASISVKERDDGFVMAWLSENLNHNPKARRAEYRGYKIDPARAWLLAILSALISETPKGETP
ncbi:MULTISPECIES: hypothetical protein [unclassified Sulfitobacter]|uniref:hypothetical protein n=1 Tax=Sulfitobacter phage pCB2047-C TaxID=754043 RepID=UPI0002C07B24|nr:MULTISPECIES: hypothetical protein [unclassified Sulfitobacter]YP_007675319.1 hypothetical protein SUBG_00062 [Sulfitobacter phage pCB2047-C]YP_007675412.1 hypothetical protein SUAG_00020 [Sulfitobacter phage pCB2047-A]YP_009146212.1 hypothetical protein SUFP_038 [Sulfitobacter phage NYA-2014a]AGG91232.1 hypothetical protein SUBG_00062 [Sulfitobacter phage pCB2047-C]AGH30746.1 hypothetical protein SUAG_00020 [Sulfitobacter phage pCB2047-A]AIM40669.1 hypothetical protein SUFP_038 [Sulfitoba